MVARKLVLVCGLSLLVGGGEAVAMDGVLPATTPGEPGRSEPIPLVRVESRLALYNEKLAHWRLLGERTAVPSLVARRPAEWAGCVAAVENLAGGYGRLKDELVRHAGAPGPTAAAIFAPWPVLFDDIAFLEGGCGQVYQQVSSLAGSEQRDVAPASPAPGVLRPPLGEQEQLEKWTRAVGLFDSGNFDESIGELTGLLNTPQASVARDKIREAQTAVATQLRRQAAGVMARKTDDPGQKKKLLSEAWTLLNKIVTGYPEATIIDKVKQNQAQIETQLDQLDPAILPRLKSPAPN